MESGTHIISLYIISMYVLVATTRTIKRAKARGPHWGMGWDGMGWTEVTRKKDGPDRFCWSRDSRKYPPDPPRDDRPNERTTDRGRCVRAGDGRAFGRTRRRIDFAAPTHADATSTDDARTGKLVNARTPRRATTPRDPIDSTAHRRRAS